MEGFSGHGTGFGPKCLPAKGRVPGSAGIATVGQMDQVVQTFATELRERLGPRVRQMLLFGSRARGDAGEGSDYDMLVVVDQRTPELRAIVLDVERGLMDRYGVLVATILRSDEEWRRSQAFPLARNIMREGVVL